MNKLASEWLNNWIQVEAFSEPCQIRFGTQQKVRAEYLDLGVLSINRNRWGYLERRRQRKESERHNPEKFFHLRSRQKEGQRGKEVTHTFRNGRVCCVWARELWVVVRYWKRKEEVAEWGETKFCEAHVSTRRNNNSLVRIQYQIKAILIRTNESKHLFLKLYFVVIM